MPDAPFGAAEALAETPPCAACGAAAFVPRFERHGHRFVACRGCGLVRLDPLPDPAALPALYERSYADGLYATFARAAGVRAATAAARVVAVRPHVPAGPWLDVGCSTGALLAAARAAGIDAEGIELSPTAVAEARRAGLVVTQAAAETFQPSRRFACVAAFDLLEHLVAPGAFLARARDWLLPGGRLVVAVPDVRSAAARLMGRRWYYYAPPAHVHYFDRRTLARLLARHGLAVIHAGPAPKLFTADYALTMLEVFNPRLHRAARLVTALLPAPLRTRPVRVPVGETLAIATPA